MEKQNYGFGVSFPMLLGLMFIGLKLTGHITWSWLWVLCPFWIAPLVAAVIILVAIAFYTATRIQE
jgi:hypothetical protein